MEKSISNKIRKYAPAIFSALIVGYLVQFFIIFIKLYSTRNMNSYPLGEMMINYSCGFIRRGLLGTVILSFTGIFGLNPLVFYKILCGIAYIATYVFIIIKLRKNKYFLFVVLTLPFGLFFNLNDWSGFGFKDTFTLLFYTFTLLNLNYNKQKYSWVVTGVLIIAGTLIHESFLFFSCPFILLALNLDKKEPTNYFKLSSIVAREKKNIYLLSLISILLIMIFILTNYGDNVTKADCLKESFLKVQAGLKDEPFQINKVSDDPLLWLTRDLKYGINQTTMIYTNVKLRPKVLSHLYIFGFSILILIIHFFTAKQFKAILKTHFLYLLFLISMMLIMFYIALDWGRWMYLAFMNFTLLIAVFSKRFEKRTPLTSFQKWVMVGSIPILIYISIFHFIPHFYFQPKLHYHSALAENTYSILQRIKHLIK